MKHGLFVAGCCALVMVALLAGGCASTAIKGTPFYTAVDEKPAGPPEDRIWAWPLVYYRDPALSILWPIFEKNDQWLAVRPVFSIYGLDRGKHQYNVLWPIAQWDWETGNHRVFPYFWGANYRALFPLYWHFNHPLNGYGTDTLFPLWYYTRNAGQYSFWAVGPVFHSKNRGGETGWHVWPVTGHYAGSDHSYRFFAWPLAHQWRGHGDRGADTIIPLFYRGWGPDSRTFISPLWMTRSNEGETWRCLPPLFYEQSGKGASRFLSLPWSYGAERDGSAWHLAFPFYFDKVASNRVTRLTPLGGSRTVGERTEWGVVPVLSWGTTTPTSHSTWVAAGLAHHSQDGASRSHHVLPLYYSGSDSDSSTFISIPYSQRRTVSGAQWDLAFPLVYRYRSPEANRWITPLAAGGGTTDGRERWHAILPLYYSQQDGQGSSLVTLAGGYHRDPSGTRWNAWPLLTWRTEDKEGSDFWALAPLIHARHEAGYSTHHVLPVYYWNSRTDSLVSLLAARWQTAASNTVTLVPPALSWKVTSTNRSDLWLAGGLARASWGAKPGPHHVVPLYYRDRERDTFISPVFAQWEASDESRVTVIPPLLGAGSSSPQNRDLWFLAGLGKASWGEHPGARYLVPLFYENPQTGSFISPFFTRSTAGTRDTRFYPPLLSLDITDGSQRDIWGLAGLAHYSGDSVTRTSSGYLLPLFYYDSTNTLLTPLFGRHRQNENGFFYPLTPLAGVRTGQRSGGWLFPLFSHTRQRESGDINGMVLWGPYWRDHVRKGAFLFPFFYHQRDLAPLNSKESVNRKTYVFPTFWKRTLAYTEVGSNSRKRILDTKNMFVPFWAHTETGVLGKAPDVAETSVLLGAWNSRKEKVAAPGSDQTVTQCRKRLLWWLWRYDRNGADMAMDIFPGISIDRKGDGFKKTAFFYRLYRNEVTPDGKRKMDILFIPILRPRQG